MGHLGRYSELYMGLPMERVKAVMAWMVWSRTGKWDIIPEKKKWIQEKSDQTRMKNN